MSSIMSEGYIMHFNQDFTTIAVLSKNGLRLFTISGGDKIDKIYATEKGEQIRIVETLFNTALIVLVTEKKPNCLKMLHFKKKMDICNCIYPTDILCVRLNRNRLVVCLAEVVHIHDTRDMKILHSIENIAPNEYGLCSLSHNSQLALPICTTSGELRIFNASKLKPGLTIKAHNTKLSAMNFSPNGNLLATASERGTVIRVFSVKNGQRVQEFRRGVKRCVRIASLAFSTTAEFLCASSNTETVHIFKIDSKAVENADIKSGIVEEIKTITKKPKSSNPKDETTEKATTASTNTSETIPVTNSNNQKPASTTSNNSWSMSGYITKAVSSYLLPTQIGDVLAQDRAFATAVLSQPGLKHVCGLRRLQNELRLLMACEDGFLYVYDFNSENGGTCKLLHVHDLRYTLEGVIELNLSDSLERISLFGALPNPPKPISLPPSSTDKPVIISTDLKSISNSTSSVIIENPDTSDDNSYADILKGSTALKAKSTKLRRLCDAIDTPLKTAFDERQFPPIAITAKD